MVEGGGEKNGKVIGILVGIEGKFGSEVDGSGGKVNCGRVGMVGREGRVGCGRDGKVVGKGGTFPWGIVGKAGNVGFGKVDPGGVVCRRWRPARPVSMIEKEIAMRKAKMVQL